MLTVVYNGSTVQMNAHDLLCSVLATEMSPLNSTEALKAQAVASYTYIKYGMETNSPKSVNLTPKDVCQLNWGSNFNKYWTILDNVVTSVQGKYMTVDGTHAILSTYYSSSAGVTETATNVWGGAKDAFGNAYSYDSSVADNTYVSVASTQFSTSQIQQAVSSKMGISLSGDPSAWFQNIKTDSTGIYIGSLTIGGKSVTGRYVRETLLNLRSAAFTINYSNGVFTFTTSGYGHGVGMSQWGAKTLAGQGMTYDQILKRYFTGVTIKG
jgi:stage II sporulation protein D